MLRRTDHHHHGQYYASNTTDAVLSQHSYRKNGETPRYYAGALGVTSSSTTVAIHHSGESTRHRHGSNSQFYADEFEDDVEDFHNDSSNLTPPAECEEDEMVEDDYLVPSVMRNGNCYMAANYNENKYGYATSGQHCSALATVKKLPNYSDQISPNHDRSMPMTPPSSSGSSCLLFIFVENPQDPAALDKLTLPFEDNLTVMDMMVRVAASKRFVVSDYKAYQFDFDTLLYRLLKPNMTMDQLRHNCVHLFVRNAPSVVDQANGNREHHINLTARLPIMSPLNYEDEDFTVHDCISRKFWVPETVAVIELLFFICDRHGLNWREWELWLWSRDRGTTTRPMSLPPQIVQLKNLHKLLSYNDAFQRRGSVASSSSNRAGMTVVVLPKGISIKRVEEMTDALMNSSTKKMKSGRIRRFFSRIFRLGKGKGKEQVPKRAISTFDISDTRPNNGTVKSNYSRSHHDLSSAAVDSPSPQPQPKYQQPPVAQPSARPIAQPGTLQEVDVNGTKATLPRVNFNKKNRAPPPPASRGTSATPSTDVEQGASLPRQAAQVSSTAANKKRSAPKPALVSKISVPSHDISADSTTDNSPNNSGSPIPIAHDISSIRETSSVNTISSTPKTPVGALVPQKQPIRVIDNPVYVRAGFESVIVESPPITNDLVQTVTHHRQEYAVVTSMAEPPRHIVSVSVMSEESGSMSKLDISSDGRQSANSYLAPTITTVPVFESPPASTSTKDRMDTEISGSSVVSPSPTACLSSNADEINTQRSSPCSPSIHRTDSVASQRTMPDTVQLPAPRVVSCTEVQINSVENDTSGRGIIRIRSGYDVSSVAKRTKVIGGGKVKDAASRLSESTILSGLKQLQMSSSMSVTSNSSVSTAGTANASINSEKPSSRNCSTLPTPAGKTNVEEPFFEKSSSTVNLSSSKSIASSNVTPAPSISEVNSRTQKDSENEELEKEEPGKTKRASLFTPRPFISAFTSTTPTTIPVAAEKDAPPPPLPAKPSPDNRKLHESASSVKSDENSSSLSSNSFVAQKNSSQTLPPPAPPPPPISGLPVPPPPPPLPGGLKSSEIQKPSSKPTVSIQPASTGSSLNNSSSTDSPSISITSTAAVSFSRPTVAKSTTKPRPASARVETSPRDQILTAIRDQGTSRLRKVPPEQKRYISVVETYVNGSS